MRGEQTDGNGKSRQSSRVRLGIFGKTHVRVFPSISAPRLNFAQGAFVHGSLAAVDANPALPFVPHVCFFRNLSTLVGVFSFTPVVH